MLSSDKPRAIEFAISGPGCGCGEECSSFEWLREPVAPLSVRPETLRRYKLRNHLSGLPSCQSCGHGDPVPGKNLFLFIAGEFVSPAGRAFNQSPRVRTMDCHKTVGGSNGRSQTGGRTQ